MSDDAGGWDVTDGERPHANVTPSAGVLASGGSAPVRARVYLRPAPQIVPAELADVLDPVHDSTGVLVDWRLNPAKLVSAHPTSVVATRDAFSRWRAAYVTERAVGDLATVRALLTWAEDRTDVSALRALTSPEVRIDPATATRLATQLAAVGRACRAEGGDGLGVASPTRPGLVRGFVVGDQPLVVLAAGTVQVSASRSGLEVVQAGADRPFPAAVLDPAPVAASVVRVVGWTVDGDGVTALSDTGEVPLGDGVAAKLLTHIAPGVVHVRVYAVPLTSVFAGLLTDLPELAITAARQTRPLVVAH